METGNAECQQANNDGGDVFLNISNPCYKKSLEDCQPIYFTIGLTIKDTINNCTGHLITSINSPLN